MTPDHYATLGVSPTAKAAVVRAAYLALMREYHPDRNPDPVAAQRAQAIIAAFKVLGDFDQRNHYDWDRRRARETAAAALAAKPPRKVGAGVVVGAIGLAAVSAWAITSTPEPRRIDPPVVEAQNLPVVKAEPVAELKRVAVSRPVEAKVERPALATPRAEPVRVAKVKPTPPKPNVERVKPVRIAKIEAVRPKPKAERTAVVRVAAVTPPAPHAEPKSPRPTPIRSAARSAPPTAKPTTDLASLDQFVMAFYGQSWRYGDAPKRAALVQSRASFVVRRGECAADACKRAAYLKLMRDVSEIVETGAPKAR